MANLFLPQLITWFRLDEHVKRLKGRVDALESNPGGNTPTLQQVTVAGNSTIEPVVINNQLSVNGPGIFFTGIGANNPVRSSWSGHGTFAELRANGTLQLFNSTAGVILGSSSITATRILELPNVSGTLLSTGGTTTGFPITGDMEFQELVEIKSNTATAERKIYFDNAGGIVTEVINTDYNTQNSVNVTDNYTSIVSENTGAGAIAILRITPSTVAFNSDDPNSRGISSDTDFRSNITDYDFTQKIYVDEKVASSKTYKTFTSKVNQIDP